MEGGTVYLMCFVSVSLVDAGLVGVLLPCARCTCPYHFRRRVIDFFSEGTAESGEMLIPRVDFCGVRGWARELERATRRKMGVCGRTRPEFLQGQRGMRSAVHLRAGVWRAFYFKPMPSWLVGFARSTLPFDSSTRKGTK